MVLSPSSNPRRARCTRLLTLWSVVGLASLSGCIDRATRDQMAAGDSVLAPLFKQTSVKEAAAWAADPYDADKRARGTLLLANAPFGGAEPYLALYRQHALDKDTNVQAAACRGLALHGQPSDVDLIIPLAKSPEKLVRLEATRSLQRLHNPSAVPVLTERLSIEKELEPDIRAEAASALGQYAETKSMQALIAALADPSLVVNVNAHESLKTLTGNDQLPAERRAWVQWQKQAATPFAGRKSYVYPVFWREKRWLDYVPFVGGPVPNETAASPTGFPDLSGASTGAPGGSGSEVGASGGEQKKGS